MATIDRPNILFVFGDQWRAQATGYAGDPNVRTPNLDRFADNGLNLTHAISNCPVCSPWRATLMTGQYPLTHSVFVNDVPIQGDPPYLAECMQAGGYDTAYIGKWHIDGHGRSAYIPQKRRKGFDYWKVRECTHDYNHSFYYADGSQKLWWDGYDAEAQTKDAQTFIRSHDQDHPFFLVLSWGPPHDPYHTAPESYRRLYDPDKLSLRDNVPENLTSEAKTWLAGYYAHCTALDTCFGALMETLQETGQAENTLVVFTSDHGDMVGSHGQRNKQRPWDESIRVPMLMRCPARLGESPRQITAPVNSPDLMPTLLGLAGIDIPDTVEGRNLALALLGEKEMPNEAALIELPACFHQFAYYRNGRDWRGLRSVRYTYVIDHDSPWMLYDNEKDACQMENLVDDKGYAEVQARLDAELRSRLAARGDAFLPGQELIRVAGYRTNERGDPIYEP